MEHSLSLFFDGASGCQAPRKRSCICRASGRRRPLAAAARRGGGREPLQAAFRLQRGGAFGEHSGSLAQVRERQAATRCDLRLPRKAGAFWSVPLRERTAPHKVTRCVPLYMSPVAPEAVGIAAGSSPPVSGADVTGNEFEVLLNTGTSAGLPCASIKSEDANYSLAGAKDGLGDTVTHFCLPPRDHT